MTIAVRFPDGSIQNVPAQLREISDPACPDTAPRFERVPLNCDSNWTYHRHRQNWYAMPRVGSLSILHPVAAEWWRSVAHMDEDAANAMGPAKRLRRQRQRQRSGWDSAA
jgi:hypothetical protein